MPRDSISKSSNRTESLSPEDAFGRVIRERRLEFGLTQVDLESDGEGEGVERSYISRLESGKNQVCLRGILFLARKLQLKPEELIALTVTRIGGSGW